MVLTSQVRQRDVHSQELHPAAPLGLCAGGEFAGAKPCTVTCPRRALGEAHRSAVSVCRRGVRLASDFVVVVCALSFGRAHRSVWLGVGGEFA